MDETELRRRFDAGELQEVATEAIRAYGSELYGLLVGLSRDADAANEIFGGACETLWRALPGFRWESTLRVWAYGIARHQFLQWTRDRDRSRRQVALSDVPELSAVMMKVRTMTAPHLRTEVKDGFARLRAALSPDDQLLLGLRLERRLAWSDIARVLGASDATPPSTREVAALRKRYERLKRELRDRAREHHLVA